MPKYQIFVSTVTVFENEGVSDDTGESLFSISGEVWLYKEWKNQKTWCLLHGWRYKMFLQLFWILEDPHLIDPTSGVGCFTVLLKALLNMCKQFCEKNGWRLIGTLGWTGNESVLMWIFVHLWNPIYVWQIQLIVTCRYSKWTEDRFVAVQHFWCRKIHDIFCRVPREWVKSKFLWQDADVMSLADKCIVVGCFVRGDYDKILMETGKFSDNIRVTENGLVSGVNNIPSWS